MNAVDPDALAGIDLSALRWDERGLIPAIVQQHDTGEVLMLAWMNADSLRQTLRLGETVFWSRSRQEVWHKGATSGNVQKVVDVRADCDADVLLVRVDQLGADGGPGVACHTGARSCFFQTIEHELGQTVQQAADGG
jgi:phosphoribosyl-AMP cyclohydrolase